MLAHGDGGIVPSMARLCVRGASLSPSFYLASLSRGVMSRVVAEHGGASGRATIAGWLVVQGIACGCTLRAWPEWWPDSGLVLTFYFLVDA